MDPAAAALAGLLVEIGRLWQRAEARDGRGLPEGVKGFSPEELGPDGIQMAWSAAFGEAFLPAELRPGTSEALVALAERLAAGETADSALQRPVQTTSIAGELMGHNAQAFWPLSPMELAEQTLFPVEQSLHQTEAMAAYRALWAELATEAASLREFGDIESLLSELLGILARMTWSIPAAYYRGRSDISLYDHSRVTAAVAACLAGLSDEELAAALHQQPASLSSKRPLAVLLRGDISGVQRFIYTITARGATPSLRGRSFFLQLLTEAIARWLLRQLGLPITNLIYASGGHFDLLVAANHESQIADLQAQLDAILLAQFDGDLYVALGSAPLSQGMFQREVFHQSWRESGRAVNRQKRQRFAGDSSALFEVRGSGGGSEIECQVCHSEGSDVKASRAPSGELVRKCALCASLEQLGKDLRGATEMVVAEVPESSSSERTWSATLRRFGLSVTFHLEDGTWSDRIPDLVRGSLLGLRTYPTRADAEDAAHRIQSGVRLSRSQRFSVNVAPRMPNRERATFEDLQDASTGLKRLGVLRMDVDNLGSLFANGIQHKDKQGRQTNAATLARVASLSSALSRFFEGWVGVLAETENAAAFEQKRTEPIYTIYSGGDDLFIVGAWDAVVRLASRIRDDFTGYASGNPHVTLSAGISLHGGKEPLYQAAETAREAMEDAKAMEGKNAINFLGQSLYWHEFEALIADRDQLLGFLDQRVDRSVLRVLMELEAQRTETIKQLRVRPKSKAGVPQIPWGPYMWRGAYLLRRFADRTKGPARDEFHKYVDELRRNDFQQIRNAALAARWVDALTRKDQKS